MIDGYLMFDLDKELIECKKHESIFASSLRNILQKEPTNRPNVK